MCKLLGARDLLIVHVQYYGIILIKLRPGKGFGLHRGGLGGSVTDKALYLEEYMSASHDLLSNTRCVRAKAKGQLKGHTFSIQEDIICLLSLHG